jgi:O-acetyl-ADP-ribose deacetylase (regulator of RNase III)/NAD-dependent SIR2 family protein deacetylase
MQTTWSPSTIVDPVDDGSSETEVQCLLRRTQELRALETIERGVTELPELAPGSLHLVRESIVTLPVDGIVNAANSAVMGCFREEHRCIDNVIHSAAGPRLRVDCGRLVEAGLTPLAPGKTLVTPAHALPSKWVLHTVGPALSDGRAPTTDDAVRLASCYTSCLDAAAELGMRSIAFCCISTGLFGYPQAEAATLAVATVQEWLARAQRRKLPTIPAVVFNTFTDRDTRLYADLLHLPVPDVADAAVRRARAMLKDATHVLVTGGAGLSAAAGIDYTDRKLFARLFPDIVPYGGTMYELLHWDGAGDPRRLWSYRARQVHAVRFSDDIVTTPVYPELRRLVADKDTFVATSNCDAMFERNGFDVDRIHTPQGVYALLQCLTPCRPDATWASEPIIRRLVDSIDPATGELAPDAELPACPHCGGPVFFCVRGGDWFIESPFQRSASARRAWLDDIRADPSARLVVLELGVGFNTPSVLRWPDEEVVRSMPGASLIRVNLQDASVPADLTARAVSLPLDCTKAVQQLSAE